MAGFELIGDVDHSGQLGQASQVADSMLQNLSTEEYPHLVEMISNRTASGYRYTDEFGIGLDLILDGEGRADWR